MIFNAILSAFDGKKNEPDPLAHYSMEKGNLNNKDLNIDEQLIINALKAVELQPQHIDILFDKLKNFKAPLTKVKI